MIVFIASGRLGNQIFQYFGLRSICQPNERLVLYGFDALQEAFRGLDATFVSRRPSIESIIVRGHSKLKSLVPSRTLNEAQSSSSALRTRGKSTSHAQRQLMSNFLRAATDHWGFSRMITLIDDGESSRPSVDRSRLAVGTSSYFQRAETFNSADIKSLTFNASVVDATRSFLKRSGLAGKQYGVVHARGDDLRESTPLLSWFASAISALRSGAPKLPLVLVSDDAVLRESLSQLTPGLLVSRESAAVDLALIAGSSSGVLSGSTFAWWGARLALEDQAGPFFVPNTYPWNAVGAGLHLPNYPIVVWQ